MLAASAGASVLLHGAVLWSLLPHGAGRDGMDHPPPIEVELVDQASLTRGSPAAQAPTSPPPPPEARTPPPKDGGAVAAAPPPPPPPPPPRPPPPRQAQEQAAAVNLGDSAQDQDDLLVRGTDVVPARPESAFHNKPPAYPAEAARRGAEGTVGLVIHVTEAGTTAWVDVAQSSGDASLDRAAREAVSLWRFQPARAHGAAVPFDYPINIRFTRDTR